MAKLPTSSQLPNLSTKRIVQAALLIVGIVAAFLFIFRFYQLALILFTAVILGTAFRPAATCLSQFGLPEAGSLVLIYGAVMGILGSFLWLGTPIIAQQASTLTITAEELYREAYAGIQGRDNRLLRRLGQQLPATLLNQTAVISPTEQTAPIDEPANATAPLIDILVVVSRLSKWLVWMMATLIIAAYWTLDGERVKRGLFLLLPNHDRQTGRDVLTAVEEKVGNYVIGQGLLCLSIAILAFITYLLIGLPYALLLALFAGLMEAVPMVGPALGAVPAIIIALSISPTTALWVVVATAIMQQLENSILFPRIMNRAVGVSPLVALLAFVGFSSLFGVAGAILSVPLTAVLQLLINRFVLVNEATTDNLDGARDKAGLLRYETRALVQDVRSQIRKKSDVATASSDQIEDSIEAIALDLDSILAQYGTQPESGIR